MTRVLGRQTVRISTLSDYVITQYVASTASGSPNFAFELMGFRPEPPFAAVASLSTSAMDLPGRVPLLEVLKGILNERACLDCGKKVRGDQRRGETARVEKHKPT